MKSKLIILLVIQIICLTIVKAQIPPASVQPTLANMLPGTYFPDANLNKFVGIWRWTSGTDTVLIALKKLICTYQAPPTPAVTQDWLYGCYTYIKNGQVVESTMQNFNSTSENSFNIIGSSDPSDSTFALGRFSNSDGSSRTRISLHYQVGANPKKLIWDIDDGFCNNCPINARLPRTMVLTKL